VALVIDVSGSITDQARNEMVKLAMSLAQEYSDISTLVVSHTDVVEFTGWARAGTMQAMAEQACKYSGGTRVQPAYDRVKELTRRAVDLLVHFTDCYIENPWPAPPAKSLLVLDWGTGYGVALPNGAKKVQVVI
jgi:predicted metal-dependent peptidase